MINLVHIDSLLRKLSKKGHLSSSSAFPFLSLLALSACGGGGSSDGGGVTPSPEPEPIDPVGYSGSVIKGPLENALVFLDYDGDGVLGADEPSVRTGADGSFSLEGNVAGLGFVAQTDSTTVDKSSGEVLDNVVLKAPSGASVVTPATTIMAEAGITKEEVSKVLGLPEGVDPTSFNPYSADVDPDTALAVEKVSQQVMTTITAVSSAVEGAGADKASAFSLALETVVEVVKEKAAAVQANPEAPVEVLDFSKAEEIQAVTAKVSTKIQETGIATQAEFEAVKADLDVAVSNVNTKINEVTDLTSEASMAAFAVATELKEQVKAAAEASDDAPVTITFTDTAAIEAAQTEKAAEIKELIDSGDVITFGVTPVAGADYTLTPWDDVQSVLNSAIDEDSDGSIVVALTGGRYAQDFTISKDIELWGSAKGLAISADGYDADGKVDEVNEVIFDLADRGRGVNETWIDGTVTVASSGVTIDGVRLHTYSGPLKFAGSNVNDFTILNSYVTGFNASDSFRYIDTDGVKSTGWTIDGNLIGGVSGGIGGSLYLTGVEDSIVSDNVFWRPGAAHMYIEDVTNVQFNDNFFLQGLHADGANQDGLYGELRDADNWGYGEYSEFGPVGYGPDLSVINNNDDLQYYGRNYVVELKGVTDTITFDGNTGKYNSGGIQFWDENDLSNSFTNTTISNNMLSDFFNADPNGLLADVQSRHESSLTGGVVFSVVDGSASDGLTITGNEFTGSIGEIYNEQDIDALILIQGEVDNVAISSNTLSWTDAEGVITNHYGLSGAEVFTQGVYLVGDVAPADEVVLTDNVFYTDTANNYKSSAILVDRRDFSEDGLGQLEADVKIVDTASPFDYGLSGYGGGSQGSLKQIETLTDVGSTPAGDILFDPALTA